MHHRVSRVFVGFCLLALGMLVSPAGECRAGDDTGWYLSLYGGKVSENSLHEFLFESSSVEFEDSKLLVVALGKKLTTYKGLIRIEGEGQVAKHWGDQDHYEFNGAVLFRWLPFPWDAYLDTSFAVGEGFSYATQKPELEIMEHDKTSKFLNYLSFDLEFVVPGVPRASLFTRIHHRSGCFGLINGVNGGSNAMTAGVKYSF